MPVISQFSKSIWLEFDMLLRFLVWWAKCSFCLVQSVLKGENPVLGDFRRKKRNFNIGLYSCAGKLSFKSGTMIDTIEAYCLPV